MKEPPTPTCDGCGEPVYYGTDGTKYNATRDGVHECPTQPDEEGEDG